MSHLFNRITAGQADLFGTNYGAVAASRWKGPYLSGEQANNDSLAMSLGWMRDVLKDSNLNVGTSGYVIASLLSVRTQADAARLDTLIDRGNGNNAGILQRSPAAGTIPNGRVKLQVMRSR